MSSRLKAFAKIWAGRVLHELKARARGLIEADMKRVRIIQP